jgi:2-dehydropantoate 2-reductase
VRYPLVVIGAGALGLSFAARLARTTALAVIARNAARAQALRAGVDVGGVLFRPEAFPPEDAPEADWVVLFVKGPDTREAARLAARMEARGVLSLQNGIVEPLLRDALPGQFVGQGVTTEGAYRDGARVVPAGNGETLVPPGFEAVADLLRNAGFAARVEPAIHKARLAKLLVNLAINPVTALFRIPNGDVAQTPYSRWTEALVREAVPVLHAEGLELDEEAALARVFAVAHGTARNRSSMLQDVLAGRRTELEELTGAFLSLASDREAQVPTHRAFYTLLSS